MATTYSDSPMRSICSENEDESVQTHDIVSCSSSLNSSKETSLSDPKVLSTCGPSSELLLAIDRFCLENDCPSEVRDTWCSEQSYKSHYPKDLIPRMDPIWKPRSLQIDGADYYLYSPSESCKYGMFLQYYENKLSYTIMYSKDVFDGPWKTYDFMSESRCLLSENYYKNGAKYGPWTEYRNNQMTVRRYYVDGKLNGRSEYWYGNGQRSQLSRYKNDKLHGISQHWNQSGQLVKRCHYRDGKLHGLEEEWSDNGTLILQTHYENGLNEGSDRRWYDNGQMMSETYYQGHRPHGLARRWYDNGLILESLHFIYGTLHGLQQSFDRDGNLVNQTSYHYGRTPEMIRQNQEPQEPVFKDCHYVALPRLEMCALCLEDDSDEQEAFLPSSEDPEKQPKCNTFAILRCGHTCCQSCIKGAFKTGRCWTCRKEIRPQDVCLCKKWDDSKLKEPIGGFINFDDPDETKRTLFQELLR